MGECSNSLQRREQNFLPVEVVERVVSKTRPVDQCKSSTFKATLSQGPSKLKQDRNPWSPDQAHALNQPSLSLPREKLELQHHEPEGSQGADCVDFLQGSVYLVPMAQALAARFLHLSQRK